MPRTILHAEDHKVVADAVRETLEECGWRVVTCADGAAAVERLAGGDPCDLLIVDHHLPHVDGLEVVRYARALAHRRCVPVIMFTASGCRSEARAAGVDAYLGKPDDMRELVPTITRLLCGGA